MSIKKVVVSFCLGMCAVASAHAKCPTDPDYQEKIKGYALHETENDYQWNRLSKILYGTTPEKLTRAQTDSLSYPEYESEVKLPFESSGKLCKARVQVLKKGQLFFQYDVYFSVKHYDSVKIIKREDR